MESDWSGWPQLSARDPVLIDDTPSAPAHERGGRKQEVASGNKNSSSSGIDVSTTNSVDGHGEENNDRTSPALASATAA